MNNFYNNNYNMQGGPGPWQALPQPPLSLPQPPFMPPNVVGQFDNSWIAPPPTISKPSPALCETFPYNPLTLPPPSMVPKPSPAQCESFPYIPQSFRWRQDQSVVSQYSDYDAYDYTPYNKRTKFKEENFIDYCDVCDRGFKTEEKKRQHYSEHTKCTEPGCKFEAHYKIVEIHKRNTHGNGFNIQLYTAEDIKKWREERRNNFPTEERVKEKQAKAAEKRCSGAVLEERSFGKYGNRRGRGRGRFNNRRGRFSRGGRRCNDDYNNDEDVESKSRNPEEVIKNKNSDQGNPKILKSNNSDLTSLSQLISNYDSDGSNDEAKDIQAKEIQRNGETNENVNKGFVGKHPKHKRSNNQRDDKQRNYRSSALSRPSLLRMLLEPEIRSERNNILQCVRYIVDKNFFDSTDNN